MGGALPEDRLSEAEGHDPSTRGNRMARGEWMAFRYVTDAAACRAGELGPQLIRLAELDVRAAENFYGAARVWHSDCWNPIAHDGVLLKFLAVVYLSRLLLGREEELTACALSLRGLVTMQELECVLDFAAGLVSQGSLTLERLSVAGDGAPAMEEDEEELASAFLEHKWRLLASRPTSREFLELADGILRSSYFLMPPSRDEGPACATLLVFIRRRLEEGLDNAAVQDVLREMEREISDCYKTGCMLLRQEDWEEYFARSTEHCFEPGWGALTTLQLKELVEAVSTGGLATLLLTTRPPNNVISSHLLAVFDCVVHARLFLERYPLPVYCHYKNLTYRSLGQNVELEKKVIQSENGFMGHIPSYVERLLKREAIFEIHECFSESGGKKLVYNVTVPSCSRLRVPTYLRDPQEAFRYAEGWDNELGFVLPATLWYESKLGFWLGVDKVEGETISPRPNPALMEEYQSMSKFREFLAPGKIRGHGHLQVIA